MNRLKDKIAIITGGAAGIGKSTAALFLRQGASVMLVDNNAEALHKTVKELASDKLEYYVGDVSKAADVQAFVKRTIAAFGSINIYFSNAGIEGISSPITDYPDSLFDQVIAVNLKGVWLGCKYVIPKMEDGSSVIITSSVAGLKGFPGLGAYVASKHGTIGIMRTAALEFAPRKIRVNTVNPGPVHTQMMRRIEENITPEDSRQSQKNFEDAVPFGRYAEAEEVASLALFLASDESQYITGCTYVVDGGMVTA